MDAAPNPSPDGAEDGERTVLRAGVRLSKRAAHQLDAILAARVDQGELLDPLTDTPLRDLSDEELVSVISRVEADLSSMKDEELTEQLTTLAYLIANPTRSVPPLWGAARPALAGARPR